MKASLRSASGNKIKPQIREALLARTACGGGRLRVEVKSRTNRLARTMWGVPVRGKKSSACQKGLHALGEQVALFGAVVEGDAAVGVASQEQAGVRREARFQVGDAG
jgi:hypothetical protein